uniref:Sushi domain-containing protein n=1 Tax=Pseudo-nitzschia australis TaxID=44445 RepID=A0A7S4AK77_9STRA
MAIILKQLLHLVLSAFLLVVSPVSVDAAVRGVGADQSSQQLDSIVEIENGSTLASSGRNLAMRKRKKCMGRLGKDKKKCNDRKMRRPSSPTPPATGTGTGTGTPPGLSPVAGRFDIPADPPPTAAPAPVRPSVTSWIQACGNENRVVNECVPVSNHICKSCLFALSLTSTTPTNAGSGIAACTQEYCLGCTSNDLMAFFDCGYKSSNPVDEAATATVDNDITEGIFPASSIRTPPPAAGGIIQINETVVEEESEDEMKLYDTVNCPVLYPRSGTDCVMIDGFEYKDCNYYELGPDVMCQCSRTQPVWSCTGTIVRNQIVAETEGMETVIEEETVTGLQAAPPVLPGADVLVSRVDVPAAEDKQPLCPIMRPSHGSTCSSGAFYAIECCYLAANPIAETFGTVTCTCGGETWSVRGGSLSTCQL